MRRTTEEKEFVRAILTYASFPGGFQEGYFVQVIGETNLDYRAGGIECYNFIATLSYEAKNKMRKYSLQLIQPYMHECRDPEKHNPQEEILLRLQSLDIRTKNLMKDPNFFMFERMKDKTLITVLDEQKEILVVHPLS